jgi:Glutathione S-transferase, N-terminal domain
MQLYDSLGPNPRAARMFLAEKGITIPIKAVDLLAAENRKPPYTDRNPGGQFPRWNWTTANAWVKRSRSSSTWRRSTPIRR